MTCIVGAAHKGIVYIGADSCGSGGGVQETVVNPKVFKVQDFVIGCTTSFRMIDILSYSIKFPDVDKDLDSYMRTKFVSELIKAFKDNGFRKEKEGVLSGGTFLVGLKGRLFTIQDDFSVLSVEKYGASVGCGLKAARGSLHSTFEYLKSEPKERVMLALKAAESISTGVRGPFKILTTEE